MVTKFLIFAFFVSAAHCMMVRSISDDPDAEVLENYNPNEDPNADFRLVTMKDIGMWFYSAQTGLDNPCNVSSDHCTHWKEWGFDPGKKTVFCTHGFLANGSSFACQDIIKAFFQAGKDYNLVVMDWGYYSQGYLTALAKLKEIGYLYATVIEHLEQDCGLDLNKVELVGHSLGAHVCGFVGQALGGRVSRIIGLDPAKPFMPNDPAKRLDISDAQYVEVCHTSGDGLAILEAIGHADFYPNGAKLQWGCDPDKVETVKPGCNHNKAPELYAASIMHPGLFTADCQCASAEDAMNGICANPEVTAYMGHHDEPYQTGIYYVETNKIFETFANQ